MFVCKPHLLLPRNRYGPEAGAAAADSVPVARDMLSATLNFSRLGARAIISGTAKRTAKVYLKSAVAGGWLAAVNPAACAL
jgi:hypothetical protein